MIVALPLPSYRTALSTSYTPRNLNVLREETHRLTPCHFPHGACFSVLCGGSHTII
jgi:hypothetical protein